MSEHAAESKPETTPKPEKKALPKIKVQDVYRLINGEWEDFESQEPIDKSVFFKAFHREYQPSGEMITEVEYDSDGNEIQRTVNSYNEKGRITRHELYNEGVFAESISFDYDEKGRLVKEKREFEEGFPLDTSFIYDEEDRVIEKRVDDNEGELQKRETFAYHPEWKDKIISHKIFDEEDKLSVDEENEWEERNGEVKPKKYTVKDATFGTYRRTEFFDPKLREDHIAYATFNDKDKVVEYVKVIYDEQDRESEEHSFSQNDSDTFSVFYTYDEHDRVILQEQHQQDKIINKINRRFNAEGHAALVAIRSFSRGMYVDYIEYEYHG
jgi:hypothetical protein